MNVIASHIARWTGAPDPLDFIGPEHYLSDKWPVTYATADIIAYDGVPRTSPGREFLFQKKA